MELPDAYTSRLEVLRDLISVYDREITSLDRDIHVTLRHHRGYQAVHGVGRVFTTVLVAEIGDVTRFRSAEALCSWAGLTPQHRESDTKVARGRITRQGPKLCAGRPSKRWPPPRRRPPHGAIARKVLTLVYYGLRDGEIRCLGDREAA